MPKSYKCNERGKNRCPNFLSSLLLFWRFFQNLASIFILAAFPNLDGLVNGSSNNVGMCFMEVDWGAKVCMSLESFTTSLMPYVPHAQAFIIWGWEQIFSSRMPRQPSNPVIMTNQGKEALTWGHIPHFDQLVTWAGGQKRTSHCAVATVFSFPGSFWTSLIDGRSCRFWCPSDTFNNMFMFT